MERTYRRMILEAEQVPAQYTLAAAAALWVVLASFVILPGTFATLTRLKALEHSQEGQLVHKLVQNIPLLPIAAVCYGAGIASLVLLWSQFKSNYIWLLSHIFIPAVLNYTSGLLAVLLNIYTARNGTWSPTA